MDDDGRTTVNGELSIGFQRTVYQIQDTSMDNSRIGSIDIDKLILMNMKHLNLSSL